MAFHRYAYGRRCNPSPEALATRGAGLNYNLKTAFGVFFIQPGYCAQRGMKNQRTR